MVNKILKTIKLKWAWHGDVYLLQGFNICLMPSGKNPVDNPEEAIRLERVFPQLSYDLELGKAIFVHNFTNILLDEGSTCTPWVQALYENDDSQWASMNGQIIEDDGSATIVVVGNPNFQQIIDMSKDDMITPQEKLQLQKEWDEVVSEHFQIELGVMKAEILGHETVTNYIDAIYALARYLNYDELYEFKPLTDKDFYYPVMLTDRLTTDITKEHYGGINKYKLMWRTYYEAKVAILEKIRDQLFENNKEEIEDWIGSDSLPDTIEIGGYISSSISANRDSGNKEYTGAVRIHYGTFITTTGLKFVIQGDTIIPTDMISNEGKVRYLLFIASDKTRFDYLENSDSSISKQFVVCSHSAGKWYYHTPGSSERKYFEPSPDDCVVAKLEEFKEGDSKDGIKTIKLLASNGEAIFDALTDGGKSQGIYRDEETGLIFINAEFMKIGRIESHNGRSVFDLDDGTFRLGGTKEANFKDFGLLFDGVDLWLGKGTIRWGNLDEETQNQVQGVSVSIEGGLRAVRIDAADNMLANITAYTAKVSLGKLDVTNDCTFAWSCKGLFYGKGTGKKFTPVKSNSYQPEDETTITLEVVYNSKTYKTVLPIPVSKDGASGNSKYVIVTGDQVFKYNLEVDNKPFPEVLKLKAEVYNIEEKGKWQYKDLEGIWRDITGMDCVPGIAIIGETLLGVSGRGNCDKDDCHITSSSISYSGRDAIAGYGITGKANIGHTPTKDAIDEGEDIHPDGETAVSALEIIIYPFTGLFADPDIDVMQVRYIAEGVYDTLSLLKVYDGFNGDDPYVLSITNESCVIPCNSDGAPSEEAIEDAYTDVHLFKGVTLVPNPEVSIVTRGCEATVLGTRVTIRKVEQDYASIDITVTHKDTTLSKTMSITKAKQGIARAIVVSGEQSFMYDKNNRPTNESITLTAVLNNLEGQGEWQYFSRDSWTTITKDAVISDTKASIVIYPDTGAFEDENVKSMLVRYKVEDAFGSLSITKIKDGQDGADGKDGASGVSYYTWIRYADDSKGSNMSSSPTNKAYIGIAYNKVDSTPSNVPSDYAWSLIKGNDGIPGVNGTDGKTYYTWIKYADTPTSGMSDDPNGKLYIGIAYNKDTKTESTNYSDYAWSLIKGEDGVDGYTIMLTNETHTFPTDSNGNIAQALTVTTQVIAFKGNDLIEATIGTIAAPSGMSITKEESTLTIVALQGTSLADTGSFNIPIMVDGKAFTKVFTWSKAKQGPQGPAGPGSDVKIPTWVDDWTSNSTEVARDYVVSPKIFAGTNRLDSGKTGISLGRCALGIDDITANIGMGVWNNSLLNMKIDTTGKVTIGRNAGSQFIVNSDGSIVTPNISADTVTSGNLQVGGNRNGDGQILIKDTNNNEIATMDKSGILVNNSKYLIKDKYGIINETVETNNFIKDPMFKLTTNYDYEEKWYGECTYALDDIQEHWTFHDLTIEHTYEGDHVAESNGHGGGKIWETELAMDMGYLSRPGDFEKYCAIGDTAYFCNAQQALGAKIQLSRSQRNFTFSLFAACFNSQELPQTGNVDLYIRVHPNTVLASRMNTESETVNPKKGAKGVITTRWDSAYVERKVTLTSYNEMKRFSFTFDVSEFTDINAMDLSGEFLVIVGTKSVDERVVMNGFQLKPGSYPNVMSEDVIEKYIGAKSIVGAATNITGLEYAHYNNGYLEGAYNLSGYGITLTGNGENETCANKVVITGNGMTFNPYYGEFNNHVFEIDGPCKFIEPLKLENGMNTGGTRYLGTGIEGPRQFTLSMGGAYIKSLSSGDLEMGSSSPSNNNYWTHITDQVLKLGSYGGRIDTTGGALRVYRSTDDYGIRIAASCTSMLELANNVVISTGYTFRATGSTTLWTPYYSTLQGCTYGNSNGWMAVETNNTSTGGNGRFHFMYSNGNPSPIFAQGITPKTVLSLDELNTALVTEVDDVSAMDKLQSLTAITHGTNKVLIPQQSTLSLLNSEDKEHEIQADELETDFINVQKQDNNIIITQNQNAVISTLVEAIKELEARVKELENK